MKHSQLTYLFAGLLVLVGAAAGTAVLASHGSSPFQPAPRLARSGLPLTVDALVQERYSFAPGLAEAVQAYLVARQDEALTALRLSVGDKHRAERTQAGLFCILARAKMANTEVRPSDLAEFEAALSADPAFKKGAAIAEASARGRRIVARTHAEQACPAVGLAA